MSQLSLFKGRRQGGIKLAPPPEFALQCAVAQTLRSWQMPGWQWGHYPAGEARTASFNRKGQRVSYAGERLKRAGTKAGWTDLILFAPDAGGSYFLELKRRGRLRNTSDAQDDFADWANDNGYPHAVVDSYDDAVAVLKHWRALRANVEVSV